MTRITAVAALFVCWGLAMNTTSADDFELFESRIEKDADGQLPYRLLQPKDYDAAKKYPLVLFLHGAGERGDDNKAQLVHGMRDFLKEDHRRDHACFVVAPQCPKDNKWVDVDWSLDRHDSPKQPSDEMARCFTILEKLQKEFSIDADRIYITGLSMGGYGTWDAIARRPDLFAAAAPICGGGDPKDARKIANMPIWVFHGDADRAVKVSRSRDMVKALKAAGGEPKYTEYPGVGHNSWARTYANPEFHDWLFSQKRSKE